jgi:hypothetical protein
MIGRRMVDAVMLVLAGSGCWSTTTTAPSGPPSPPPPNDTGSNATGSPTNAPPDPWAEPPPPTGGSVTGTGSNQTTVVVTSGGTAGFDPLASTDPRQFCTDYKRRNKIDKSQATGQPKVVGGDRFGGGRGGPGGPRGIDGYFDRNTRSVHCTIVHEEVGLQRKDSYTPTCCPSGRGNTPCPPTQTVTVTDRKLLVETVEVAGDGTKRKATLEWRIYPHQFEHHNCGRRPEGLVVAGELAGTSFGAELARMAELEAASVPAFERLARELAHHGAPAALVGRAQAAMRDEIRHARVIRALACRFGCAPRTIAVPALPCRSLLEIARENAIEGCVREAFGALIATFQAERASPELRGVFAAIARDERRHAELAEAVEAWISSMLDVSARDTIASDRAAAAFTLRADLELSSECSTLGLPGPGEARALFDAYFAA